jgi:dipeptidase D
MSTSNATLFAGLAPASVWSHFATLCSVPRASKQEGAIRATLEAWARARGLPTRVDAVGNLIVTKPASKGREGSPTVLLQSHLDMVTQKNSDSAHDFSKDALRPVVKDGWVVAPETTLGADNGMGVAMTLAVLGDDTLAHGPLEALFTIDEETGMTGANGLASGELKARYMLNLDTEEWGEFYLGCAGGVDVDVREALTAEPVPAGYAVLELAVRGLRGGHSGVDIHEGRGNAIRALLSVLSGLRAQLPVRLSSLEGGTARNAIAREASAVVALPEAAVEKLPALLAAAQAKLRAEYGAADPGVTVTSQKATASQVLVAASEMRWLDGLAQAPYGVRRMSTDVPGVVETSNNLGVVRLTPAEGYANFMVRSLVDAEYTKLAQEISAHFTRLGMRIELSGGYPGWKPNPASPLLARCQAVYQEEFHAQSQVKVIHAGLECGIIGAKYPGLDTVSFGPTIRGAHAPGERVEIASVEHCFRLVCRILERLAA